MRNLLMLSTLSIVATGILTGGLASANTGHREPIRTPVRTVVERRAPVVVAHREVNRPIVIRNQREVDLRGRETAQRFENQRYEHGRYVRAGFNERYFDIRVQPAPIFEDCGAAQSGYVWVTGNWQWNGAEWIWFAGHYVAA